jgi:hypothetical protein
MTPPASSDFKLRVLVAKEPDSNWPVIFAAMSEDTWEIIPPEEWDKFKRDQAAEWLGPDWTANDFAEAVLPVPMASLRSLFSPSIPAKLERVDD